MTNEAVDHKGSSVEAAVDWPGKPTGKNYYLPWLYDGKKH